MRVKVLAIFRWCERTNSSPYGDSGSYLCNTKLEFPMDDLKRVYM